MSGSGDNRSVKARDITGSSVVTGDRNIVTTTMKQVAAPPADQVDVKAELAALRDLLAELKNGPIAADSTVRCRMRRGNGETRTRQGRGRQRARAA
jgi:hypothetical protein